MTQAVAGMATAVLAERLRGGAATGGDHGWVELDLWVSPRAMGPLAAGEDSDLPIPNRANAVVRLLLRGVLRHLVLNCFVLPPQCLCRTLVALGHLQVVSADSDAGFADSDRLCVATCFYVGMVDSRLLTDT